MKTFRHYMISVCIVFAAGVLLPSFSAAETVCSYKKEEQSGGLSFNLSSEPMTDCSTQVLKIVVKQNGKTFTHLVNGTDKLVENSWVEDLAQNGNPELIVVSRNFASPLKKSLDVYTLEGNILRLVSLPELTDPNYRGGDEFKSEGGRILRIFSLYRDGDPDGSPSGGKRTLSYQFRNRELLLGIPAEYQQSEMPVQLEKVVNKGRNRAKGAQLKITGITVKADYVEILADGRIENYRILRIADPWRLVIDIPGAKSVIANKNIKINKHGISTARIGENKGFLRIVFDSAVTPLPTETITPAENALRVSFYSIGEK